MNKVLCLLLTLTAWFIATQTSFGEDFAPRRLAATDQLPPALAALNPSAAEFVTEQEAEDVRGEWIINFNFPLLATQIEGWGRFEINMITLSGGKYAGQPVFVRLTIGR
jgi:hypothetical protein